MIILGKNIIDYIRGMNIFINIILLANLFFPELILAIDYNQSIVIDALLSANSLFIREEFYLFAKQYNEHYELIYYATLSTMFLASLFSILGSIKVKKAYIFILIACLIDVVSPIFFPTGINRWEIHFLANSAVILNAIILGYYLFASPNKH